MINAALAGVAHSIVSIVFNSLWEGMLIAGLLGLTVRVLRMNAATRYLIWAAALTASVVLPLVTTLSLAPASDPQAFSARKEAKVAASIHAVDARFLGSPAMRASISQSPTRIKFTLPRFLVLTVLGIWALGGATQLLRLCAGFCYLQRLKRTALPLDPEYRLRLPLWHRAANAAEVRLCTSADITVPIAVGIFDSMILLPRSLIMRMTGDEVDWIILHELAHLRRHDDWASGIQRIIESLFFFNPAIFWISRQLGFEREVACDDWAVTQGAELFKYAECLAKIAHAAVGSRRFAPAAPGIFLSRRDISLRIERLLSCSRDARLGLRPLPAALALTVLLTVCIVSSNVRPSFAYENRQIFLQHRATRTPTGHTSKVLWHRGQLPLIIAHAVPRRSTRGTFGMTDTRKSQAASRFVIQKSKRETSTRRPIIPQARFADLRSAGYDITVDQRIDLASSEVPAEYVLSVASAGAFHPSLDEIVNMHVLGVTAQYVRSMHALLGPLTARQYGDLQTMGINSQYVAGLISSGVRGLSATNVLDLYVMDIDGSFVRAAARSGFTNLTPDQLVKLKSGETE